MPRVCGSVALIQCRHKQSNNRLSSLPCVYYTTTKRDKSSKNTEFNKKNEKTKKSSAFISEGAWAIPIPDYVNSINYPNG